MHARNRCPHDPTPLRHDRSAPVGAWRCERCEGLWLPAPTVARVVGDAPRWPAATSLPRTALVCPDDGTRLRAIEADGIEIDLCPFCHGVWLDRGEFVCVQARVVASREEQVDVELLHDESTRTRSLRASSANIGVPGFVESAPHRHPSGAGDIGSERDFPPYFRSVLPSVEGMGLGQAVGLERELRDAESVLSALLHLAAGGVL